MSETQKQALQRFFAGLIAQVIALVIAVLQSDDLRVLIFDLLGQGGLWTGLILAAIGPIVLALGKLNAGPTEKVVASPEGVRSRARAGAGPGLFG